MSKAWMHKVSVHKLGLHKMGVQKVAPPKTARKLAIASLFVASSFASEFANAQPRPPPPGVINPGRGVIYQGEILDKLPPGTSTIRFNSTPYYFSGGNFYSKIGSEYVKTAPPVGLRINELPPGAVMVPGSRQKQFTYNGVLYKKFGKRWEVVGGG